MAPMRITLRTTGRSSGRLREVHLYAFDDSGRLVVTGSNGGSDRDPDWVRNLRSEPCAIVRQGRRELSVRAAEARSVERGRLWQLVCAGFPLYERYQQRTDRRFPIFVLEARPDADVS